MAVPESTPRAAASLIAALSAQIDAALSPLVPSGSRCALLDFPNHANVGDSAIWLGESRWLGRRNVEVVYTCDTLTYQNRHLADRIGNGIILLHGGGNLGDFWVEHQKFREMVIAEFPRNRIVQLPQTIHFIDDWGKSEAARVFNAHPDLTVLCRDHGSLAFARERFKCPSALCPDMAFAIGPLDRLPPRVDILWLARTDAESAGSALPTAPDVEIIDWLEESPFELRTRNETLSHAIWQSPLDPAALVRDIMATYDPLAETRVCRGVELLSRGRVVVTDRLHGHILCLLLGIPHVLLDNNYGKIRSYHHAFTKGSPLTHVAAAPEEALSLARKLIHP